LLFSRKIIIIINQEEVEPTTIIIINQEEVEPTTTHQQPQPIHSRHYSYNYYDDNTYNCFIITITGLLFWRVSH